MSSRTVVAGKKMRLLVVILLSLFACFEASSSSWENATIAVVEFQPIQNSNLSELELVKQNTDKYISLIKSINETKLDIVIFPEDTLGVGHQTAVEYVAPTPCSSDDYPEFMQQLSCAARERQTYLVLNLVEKIKCPNQTESRSDNCKKDGFHYYNTDFVFDRDGTIVNRYHKYNLFGERTMDRPDTDEEIVIKTDFGLNLGIFTCFDILFKAPALKLLNYDGIDGIIFPSMWFSELPFLTAMQTQHMYAHGHHTNLLAAGANNPKAGSGGSGVYKGAIGTIAAGGFNAEGGDKVFIYKGRDNIAPSEDVNELAKKMDGFHFKTDSSVKDYHFQVINTSVKHSYINLTYNGTNDDSVFCEFDIWATADDPNPDLKHYTYLAVAYSGVRSYSGVYNGGIELCGIIACLNSSLSSCGQRFPKYEEVEWNVIFEVTIKGTFENNENKVQMPNSLLSSMRPIYGGETLWSSIMMEEDGKELMKWTFGTVMPQSRLMTFAIYGRNFANDSPPNDDDNNLGSGLKVTWMLVGCSVILSFLFSKK